VSNDENNLTVGETYRIKNRLKDGSTGKFSKYTINLHHTTCRIVVNGREAQTTFLTKHLTQIRDTIDSSKELLDQLDKELCRQLYRICILTITMLNLTTVNRIRDK
jgi:hypothetical protein